MWQSPSRFDGEQGKSPSSDMFEVRQTPMTLVEGIVFDTAGQ